ncbi:hypothetical protein JOE26_001532 [Rhodococcus coprophilus]|uniref:Uncharacterized protein n=1 Tax=Rhodococcus coprophilus TaxID=38310 RepID=A0A2X4UE87_9NOCA|nr:hypothetical protein [Rhodococcus coprophilus]SQI33808.1 Uncharacterised protein [Rhodococcus coprophilus]
MMRDHRIRTEGNDVHPHHAADSAHDRPTADAPATESRRRGKRYLGSLAEQDRAECIAAAQDLHDAMNETGTEDFRACSRGGRPPGDGSVPDGIRSLQQLRALARTIRTSSRPDPTEIRTVTNAGTSAATPTHRSGRRRRHRPGPARAAGAVNRAGGEAGATMLVIAGRSSDIDTATAKAHAYPTVTVAARYDLPGPGPAQAISRRYCPHTQGALPDQPRPTRLVHPYRCRRPVGGGADRSATGRRRPEHQRRTLRGHVSTVRDPRTARPVRPPPHARRAAGCAGT